jgi:hypothetical protein
MRRRYLWLLAVFVPTVLGLAALSYLIFAPGPQSEASTTTPIVRQAPQVQDTISDETVAAPADADVIESSAPRNDETPGIEPESPQQRPAHAESSDIIGPPMLATATDSSTDAPTLTQSRGSIRLANLSAVGGGGGAPSTNGSSKTSGDSTTAPVDTSNSGSNSGGDSSTSGGSSNTGSSGTGGDTDPNGGKGGGAGGDSAAPNTPNPNPDHDEEDEEEDPPVSDNDPYPTDPFPHEDEHPPVQVPEPASFGLLLLGLAGFATGRRRKK